MKDESRGRPVQKAKVSLTMQNHLISLKYYLINISFLGFSCWVGYAKSKISFQILWNIGMAHFRDLLSPAPYAVQ